MDGRLAVVAKEGKEGSLMLAEFPQHVAVVGEMGNLYTSGICKKVHIEKQQKLE
jgi:hypothetical protein